MSDSCISVRLFGVPRVEQAGTPLPFGRQKGLALLAVLCAEPQPHSRDKLLALLWPLFGSEDGRNNLRRELSLLKSLLGDRLLADRAAIGLDTAALADGRLEIDVHRFETLLAEAGDHDGDDVPGDECAAILAEAATLYSDHFLAGFTLPDSPAFDEWQFFCSEHYRQAAAMVFRRLALWHEARGEFEPAINYARRWLALDTLHEPAHRALMRLYEQAGQHAAALRQYETLVRALSDELGAAPEPESETLHEAIRGRKWAPARLSGAAAAPVAPAQPQAKEPPNNLPTDTTPFIGRKTELAELDRLLSDPEARLITIASIGGMGKTRLALASLRRQLARLEGGQAAFPDGIFWVALAPLEDSSQIAPAIARALDYSLHGEQEPQRQVIDYLRRQQLLLLLDNYEHLADRKGGEFLIELLAAAPRVRVLTTSRTRLNVRGEQLFPLEGLDVLKVEELALLTPAAYATIDNLSSAVALFQATARRVQPGFALNEATLPAVLRICRLVHGMPLGIELAAGWLELLRIEDIDAEIQRSLDFLQSDWHDLPERQSSLKAVFDTSWRLLDREEQATLRALTVFRGGFCREAAETVAGASLRRLHALGNKSWISRIGENRYHIHELLRQYAEQELESIPEASKEVRQRHAGYYTQLLDELYRQMRHARPESAYVALETELDNIRLALGWLTAQGELAVIVDRMMPALFHYMESQLSYHLLVPQILAAEEKAQQLALAREYAIFLTVRSAFFRNEIPLRFYDFPWIQFGFPALAQTAWQLLPTDLIEDGLWNVLLAWQYGYLVDTGAGIERLRALVALFRSRELIWETGLALQSLGHLLVIQARAGAHNEPDGESSVILREAYELLMQMDDEREAALALLFRGYERLLAGDLDSAQRLSVEAQRRLYTIGEQSIAANVNWQLAEVYLCLGQTRQSLDCLYALVDSLMANNHPYLAIPALSQASYEAVRYAGLPEALQLRQRSMTIATTFNAQHGYDWDVWEMGEIYRVMGEPTTAREWFDRAAGRFVGNAIGLAFVARGLGDLALSRGDLAEATQQYEESLRRAQEVGHVWLQIYICARLGRAATQAGDSVAARRRLGEALRLGLSHREPGGLTLAVFAACAAYLKTFDRAALGEEIAGLVIRHPLTWRETRAEAAATLGIEVEEAERRRQAQPFDLGPTIGRLRAEIAG